MYLRGKMIHLFIEHCSLEQSLPRCTIMGFCEESLLPGETETHINRSPRLDATTRINRKMSWMRTDNNTQRRIERDVDPRHAWTQTRHQSNA